MKTGPCCKLLISLRLLSPIRFPLSLIPTSIDHILHCRSVLHPPSQDSNGAAKVRELIPKLALKSPSLPKGAPIPRLVPLQYAFVQFCNLLRQIGLSKRHLKVPKDKLDNLIGVLEKLEAHT
ncbi:hypothetical protein SORBI_3005G080025 [Sorghum bicolor]|uniref:Uncharacterized protein n=1 Tax=Sorghum bicolor TaxID=4558 RepID=A0A1Z5RHC2_SORBI|nr:hypothetical protein SORBI_3005G080025 [Sorghum bicolor]